MYWRWWIPVFAFLMLLGYSIIFFMEWKYPKLKQRRMQKKSSMENNAENFADNREASYENNLQPEINVWHSKTDNHFSGYKKVMWLHWFKGCVTITGSIITGWLFASYLFFISHYFTGFFGWVTQNIWLQRLFSFLFLDGIMYAWHRINHLVPSLWKYHELHHREEELNVFSTFHFHPKEIMISTAWRCLLLPLMGIEPAAMLTYNLLFFTVILFHHSNVNISYRWDKFLQLFIVSPGLHHVHHSVIMQESNSNFGSLFSFWDRIFGSHTTYKNQKIKYGAN